MRGFIPNPSFVKELEITDEIVETFEAGAQKAADEANARRRTIMREEGAVLVKSARTRYSLDVWIVNTDPGGHWDEWGNVNLPAGAPLRNGVRAAGFRLEEN